MRNTKIIFLREFRSYFNSPIAYIVLIVFLAVSGWFFTSDLFLVNQASIIGYLGIVPLLFLFFIPAVNMRLIAEEERLGTIETLATLPIRDFEIIFGKYLAALALISIGIVCTLVYPISISFIGNLDWGQVLSSYIGLILLAAGFGAIGIFASSITKSQIVAFILGLIICFVLFILGKILVIVPAPLVSFVEYLSIDYHFNNIIRGVIDSRDIIYYFSMIAFFLLITFYFYRRSKQRLISSAYVCVIVGIIVFVNFLSYNIFKRLDLTQGNIYSLSPSSIKLIRSLKDPVLVEGYITSDLPSPYNARGKYLRDILYEYKAQSKGKVKLEIIDPKGREKELEARRLGIMPITFTEIRSDKYETRLGYMGLALLYGDEKETIPVVEDITGLEYEITSKIKKLTQRQLKTVGFTTNHGEVELSERLRTSLEKQYIIKNIDLAKEEIPADVVTLVVAGPKTEFSSEELNKLREFINRGGKIGFFIDKLDIDLNNFTGTKVSTGLDSLLAEYGIKIKKGLVLDRQNQTIGLTMRQGLFTMRNIVPYPFFPKVTNFNEDNPIVKRLESVTFPYVSPIEGGTPIAYSSKNSWYMENVYSLNPLQQYSALPNQQKGPFALAVEFRVSDSRGIVCGTSKIIEPNFASASEVAFFLNAVDWLSEDESLIAIRSKGVRDRPLREISKAGRSFIKWIDTILPSLLLAVFGVLRWRRRKSVIGLVWNREEAS
ncbi:MAG TPA: hypothetical protein EYP60_08215 [bacterium (Candidatus Stahlbacteria)]|nr:hypothetical protein [Candidatus Stahlbacteria bacterium]